MNYQPQFADYFKKRMFILSVAIAFLVAVSMPVTFFIITLNRQKEMASTHSVEISRKFTSTIKNNPLLWSFNAQKISQIFAGYESDTIMAVNVYNNQLGLMEAVELKKPTLFGVAGKAPIIYNNKVYGYAEVIEDTSRVWYLTGILITVFSAAGLLIGYLMFHFPTRIIVKAENETVKAFDQLRHAAIRLRESEVRMRSITDNMLDMICQTDLAGIIEYVSPSHDLVLNVKPREMTGRRFLEFVHGEDWTKVQKALEEACRSRSSCKVEFRGKAADGEYLWLESVINCMYGENKQLSGLVLCTRNVTEHKCLQQQVARYEKLNLIGEMAAGIGHEIRNPMTTVRGFLQLIGSKEELQKYRDYISLMIDELDRANSIIKEYLNLAKDKSINLVTQNINRIIRTILPLIQADALLHDKEIITDLRDVPEYPMDEKEIRQLILNLARNGLEAMATGGKLTIRTFSSQNKVILAIQDRGEGIDAKLLEKIGTPFFTTKDYGTGLGLAVCYSIAARHNAEIRIETGPKGTTFYVVFAAGNNLGVTEPGAHKFQHEVFATESPAGKLKVSCG